MIGKFSRGAGYVILGFQLIRRPGIRRYVVIPLLINILLFGTVIGYGITQYEVFVRWLLSYLPFWLDWLSWLLWPIFILTAMLVVFYIFTPVANIVSAPFNDFLAERLEMQLTGESAPESAGPLALLSSAGTAIGNELRKLVYLLVWMVPLLGLFLIPGINVIAPFLWFVFGAWMLAVEYADYPMGNYDMKFRDERALLASNRGLALGFGGTLMLMTMVPVLNFIAMPVGVAGATALWVEQLRSQVPTRPAAGTTRPVLKI